MLTQEQNETFARTGRGTPMGELLRRYWLPFAAVSEFEAEAIQPVRLLGEDLVVYKDKAGTFGMVDRHCPHRRADLLYGWVEDQGIRCSYHGWCFDADGSCLSMPFEDTAHPEAGFRQRIHINSYPVEAKAGLLWVYMGPLPAPLVPTWEPFTWKNGFKQIVLSEIPCNWFQCAENNIDPVHFEWLHSNWSRQMKHDPGLPVPPTHLKVRFQEFEYGMQYQRVLEGQSETDELWTVGRVNLWPNCLFTGEHFEWRIPIDDERTLSVGWFYNRVPEEMEPFEQETVPAWHGPIQNEETGRWINTHVMNQDFIAWVGQGTIADRTQEHLGESDKGVIQYRRKLLEEAEKVARGEEPMAIIRDPAKNTLVELPIVGRDRYLAGYSIKDTQDGFARFQFAREFPFQQGQPEEIRLAYRAAMGIDRAEAEAAAGSR